MEKNINAEQVKNDLETSFNSKPEKFYSDGIENLKERWEELVNNDGKYILD